VHNPEVATHLLDAAVYAAMEDMLLDPGTLAESIDVRDEAGEGEHRRVAEELAKIAGLIQSVDDERSWLIDQYATDQMAEDVYIKGNRALDGRLAELRREKVRM
jgi:hypothetical protein